MSANDKQIGGQHYQTAPIQHWDIVAMHKLDYFQGQIIKYVMRWNAKGGVQDLRKAQHFLEKYIELNDPPVNTPRTTTGCICARLGEWNPNCPVHGSPDPHINPTMPWPKRVACTCELNDPKKPCELHFKKLRDDGSEPAGQGYVNQDR